MRGGLASACVAHLCATPATERVLNNSAVERLLEKEKALGADIKIEDILPEVAGVYPKIMKEGDMDAGAWSCGMVAGLINDVPTVQELMDRIMSEALSSSDRQWLPDCFKNNSSE